jgi:hypothetical protein
MSMSIDTSYCTVERIFGILPVLVVAPIQEARIVAYAIGFKEDASAHEVVFRAVEKN